MVALTELGGAPPEHSLTVFKPVRPSQLHTALLEAFGWGRGDGPVEAPLQPKSLRILLADDNEMNQTVGLRLLRRAGYEADVVSNGREVIDSLRRQKYDVVLMDMQMPIMDGLDATREIHRLWARWSSTAHHRPDRQRATGRSRPLPRRWYGRLSE